MKPDQAILEALNSALSELPAGPLAVALSGGVDSASLLHGLSQLTDARLRGLRAIHVDHGLHAQSGEWAAHCERICRACDVPLTTLKASVDRFGGAGLEAAARKARYDAFECALVQGEFLALAQHRDDQAETVLLKLLRGAGPEGLGGMRVLRRLGNASAWRPLLDISRDTLRRYAEIADLDWIEDPSNADIRIERNFLRHEVMPALRKRWPRADVSISQSAEWIRAAADFIDDQASQALASLQGLDPATLDYQSWLALPRALRDPVLRRWLRHLQLPEPNQHQVAELERQLIAAGEEKLPCVRWPGAEVRRYRELLYAMATLRMPELTWESAWDGRPLSLPAGLGSLSLNSVSQPDPETTCPEPMKVQFRRGGERLRLNAGGYHRDLRDLFQETGIPPWQRGRIPIVLNCQNQILSIGDLWLSDLGEHEFERTGRSISWIHD